ncbi:MAG: Cell division protein FtsQ [Chloroflexi bacterium ADurb.Bin360]|nr:MAG: Cell division protein FtsQ [Chloroflexi bacterium ADurb.Bin360]
MAKRSYPRTAALLGAQPVVTRQPRETYRGSKTAAPAIRIPWRAILPALLLAGALLWLWLDPAWYVDATRIHVTGSAIVETRRDVALAGQVLGMHGFWLRPSTIISEVLAAVPVVAEADASCKPYPAACTISVIEREPVVAWVSTTGASWVDAEGFVMPVRSERQDLPVVNGPLPAEGGVPLSVLEGVRALQTLQLPGGVLGYHPERGLVWYSPDGIAIAFGVGPDMAPRWEFCERLLTQLRAQGISPTAVDVQVITAPVYKLSGAW